ncbi:hypothetical protein BKA82DRAFT_1000866 [Pisolithus tinctorius]|nr:hypothetical protein BKA82DRAFT_1000866 [Pisolithus tinctorius]
MHPYPHNSFMHPDHPNSTVVCSTFFSALQSSDPCLPPAQPNVAPNVLDHTCPGCGEGGGVSSLQGFVCESYPFGGSIQYTSEPSQVIHPSITCMSNNTTSDAELGPAGVDNANSVFPQNAVQEVNRICDASCGAGALVNETQYANCPPTRCLYSNAEGTLCLQEISCGTVSSHFVGHGIRNKSRKEVIYCGWEGCVKAVARHTFVRHIREVHLGHVRGTSAHSSDSKQQT